MPIAKAIAKGKKKKETAPINVQAITSVEEAGNGDEVVLIECVEVYNSRLGFLKQGNVYKAKKHLVDKVLADHGEKFIRIVTEAQAQKIVEKNLADAKKRRAAAAKAKAARQKLEDEARGGKIMSARHSEDEDTDEE